MLSRAAVRASRHVFARRSYSTASSHASPTPKSSDAIWMIGSAAVFVPTVFYLTRPPVIKAQHAHTDKDDHVSPSRKEPSSFSAPKTPAPEEEDTPEPEPAAKSEPESEPESKSSTSDADKRSSKAERDVKTTAEAATANAAEKDHSSAHEMKTHKSSGPKDVHEATKTAQQTFTKEKEEAEEK
ncbi:BQ2448_722 [Microbotryum intermedium]|uniref:BQ2448_722 protein n=1 Tax=Microbotryum intermedium TaxID=269621 RepID=A0A238F917_9BASI|nr:BQ2448_722 [Microbotryum intermedium]